MTPDEQKLIERAVLALEINFENLIKDKDKLWRSIEDIRDQVSQIKGAELREQMLHEVEKLTGEIKDQRKLNFRQQQDIGKLQAALETMVAGMNEKGFNITIENHGEVKQQNIAEDQDIGG